MINLQNLTDDNERFTFRYCVEGIDCEGVNKIFLEIVSGTSRDFLIFYQDERPSNSHQVYAIEETKTSDKDFGIPLSERHEVCFY